MHIRCKDCTLFEHLLLGGIGSASAGDEDDGGHREDEEGDREGTDTSRAHLLDGGARSRSKALSCHFLTVSRARRRILPTHVWWMLHSARSQDTPKHLVSNVRALQPAAASALQKEAPVYLGADLQLPPSV